MKRTHTIRNFFLATRTGKAVFMALCALVTIATISYAAQNRRGPKVTSVTVEAAASGDNAITAFSFEGLDPVVTGTIDESSHTVALTVPSGTTLTDLVSTFTLSDNATVTVGGTAQVSGTTSNDFTNAVTYTVRAENGDTQAYTVSVSVAQNTAKAITAFSFANPAVTGTIDEANHTIALLVPKGTARTNLVSTFTLSDNATVKVGDTAQVSGTTSNNFTNPVTYTVTAENGDTQVYTVTVNVALEVGDEYGGGIVVYILQPNESIGDISDDGKSYETISYAANVQHGLIAATADCSDGATWGSTVDNTLIEDATSTTTGTAAFGKGAANTAVLGNLTLANYPAAAAAIGYSSGDYDDWYLPSFQELNKLYEARAYLQIYSLHTDRRYWSSSETTTGTAYSQFMNSTGSYTKDYKGDTRYVRAVRAF